MKGEIGALRKLRPIDAAMALQVQAESLFTLLAKNKSNLNVSYPEESLSAPEGYKCSILINMIRHSGLDWPNFRENVLCLFEYGAHL